LVRIEPSLFSVGGVQSRVVVPVEMGLPGPVVTGFDATGGELDAGGVLLDAAGVLLDAAGVLLEAGGVLPGAVLLEAGAVV
jgi:hypothetical protein